MSSSSKSAETSFQELAGDAPIMIWMAGLDLGCFYFNRAWLEFRGRTTEQEYGNGWAEGVHPDDLDRCIAHYTACFRDRTAFAMSYRLQDAEGAYRSILDRGAPHFSVDGEFLGFVGGCAELENQSPAAVNAQLRTSLSGVTDFARNLAATHLETSASNPDVTIPLKTYAQRLKEAHAGRNRELKHAFGQMEKLATDMVTYRGIPDGVCLK